MNLLLWPNGDNLEVVEPSLGLVGAVADDEVVATHGLVAHIITISGAIVSVDSVANGSVATIIADAYRASPQVVIKLEPNRFLQVVCNDVRAAHVAIGKRTLDIDFALVVGFVDLLARTDQGR